jgi:hypothetical protein
MTSLTHVDETLAIATMDILGVIMPQGFDICDPAPSSLEACTEYFRTHGKVGVDPSFEPTSIFCTPEHTHAFNAWHDWCHVKGQCTFDMAGERRVDEIMQQHLARWWVSSRRPVAQAAFDRASTVLKMFNLGRLEYWLAYGEPPADPRQFLLGYLTAKDRIVVPDLCGGPLIKADLYTLDLRNEWTDYTR